MAAKLDIGYEYVDVLGKGGFGTVFLLKRKDDGQKVAVKQIMVQEQEDRSLAIREASILCKLKHANIISYLETFQDDENVLIVTEFCEGGDLYDYLKNRQGRVLNEKHILLWIYQMTSALQYMHHQNILHRDLKTNNMFVTCDLNLKLGDMGLAKVLELGQSKAATVAGTYFYMPPELYRSKPYNHKADIWSLGCCAYEIATLELAFRRVSLTSIVQAVLHGEMPKFPVGCSASIQTMIYNMLKRNPEERPSCDQLLQKPFILRKAEFWNIQDVISSVGPIEDSNNNTKKGRESVPGSSTYDTAPGVPMARKEDRNNNLKKSKESAPNMYSTAPVVSMSWRAIKSKIEKVEKQKLKHMLHKIGGGNGKSDVGAVGQRRVERPSKENEQTALMRRILTYKSDGSGGGRFLTARDLIDDDHQGIRLEILSSASEEEYGATNKCDIEIDLNFIHRATIPAPRSDKEDFVPFEKKKTEDCLASMKAFITSPKDLGTIEKQAKDIDRELEKEIGERNMRRVYEFFDIVQDDYVLKNVLVDLIGQQKFHQYEAKLYFLRIYLMKNMGARPNCKDCRCK